MTSDIVYLGQSLRSRLGNAAASGMSDGRLDDVSLVLYCVCIHHVDTLTHGVSLTGLKYSTHGFQMYLSELLNSLEQYKPGGIQLS